MRQTIKILCITFGTYAVLSGIQLFAAVLQPDLAPMTSKHHYNQVPEEPGEFEEHGKCGTLPACSKCSHI